MGQIFETVIYPFLFLTLFFEVFAILTFFDTEARRRRAIRPSGAFPTVSIIVPCFNEEKTVRASVESLLALDYPREKLSIIVVDDGSTDGTARILKEYAGDSRVSFFSKENGGKYTALNLGIRVARSEFIGCLDADSYAATDALLELMAHFDNQNIGAVTASLSVHAPKNAIERMQQAEYLIGIAFRHILAILNGLYVTPGPLTVYRRTVFAELGPFRKAHDTEDMEIALRMQRAGWKIQNAPRARVYTEAPNTLPKLLAQRTRWTSGFIRNAFDYRDLFGNPARGVLGLMVLPLGAVSIVSGITLFVISIATTGEWIWKWMVQTLAVPLPYALQLPSLDWFFAPVNVIVILSLAAIAIAIGFIATGAYISRTKTKLGLDILWYVPLYGLVAPLWLIRAVADVAVNARRTWH